MDIEYILLVLLMVLIILVLMVAYYLLKAINNQRIPEFKTEQLENNILIKMVKEIGDVKEHMAKEIANNNERLIKDVAANGEKQLAMYNNFEKSLSESLAKNIKELNEKVEGRLNEGFNKTNQTFEGILERISKIDEAQKKIQELSTNIISLQDILSDKKSRGCFGEIQLHTILASIFGDKNDQVYELQKHLPNNVIADAVLYCPKPLGVLCIDSKFPLENYQRMMDKNLDINSKTNYERQFKQDCKKHINDIKTKYIIDDVTSDQAIMFLPAEAIFAEINAYHPDIVEYAQKNRVWLTSPTTLMATLTTIQVILRNVERDKHAKEIQIELGKLAEEFSRYRDRWDKLSRSITTVNKDVSEIHITTQKISNRFDAIQKVDLSAYEIEKIESND